MLFLCKPLSFALFVFVTVIFQKVISHYNIYVEFLKLLLTGIYDADFYVILL